MSWKDLFPRENIYYENENGILYCNDVIKQLKQFPSESIDLIITSPPYDNLRYYGSENEKELQNVWNFEKFKQTAKELYRILKKGGIAIIHHAGKNDKLLPLARFLSIFGKVGNVIKAQVIFRKIRQGVRSDVSKEMVADFSKKSGLKIIKQVNSWGSKNEYGCKRYGDWITILEKTKFY